MSKTMKIAIWVAIIGGGIGYFFLYGELVNLMR